MRYSLRTLLIVVALGPPALAGLWLTSTDPLVSVSVYGTLAGLSGCPRRFRSER